ncbi:hypothetical protein ACIQNU_04595 [Streptomyces sp. NPDC091292]|uniref:hypothetical protein n=1 Tax=Streptomyces sp. NPDC091292 TaxID=3365991 RepID=UPI00381C51A1
MSDDHKTNYGSDRARDAERLARKRGWEPQEPVPFQRNSLWLLKCTTCGREERRSILALIECDHGDSANRSEAYRRLEQTAYERVRAAGWEPIEPYPGRLMARWRLKCTTCGHEVGRQTTPAKARPCTHPGAQPKEPKPESPAEARKRRHKELGWWEMNSGDEAIEPDGRMWLQCRACGLCWLIDPAEERHCKHRGVGDPNPPRGKKRKPPASRRRRR